MFGKLSKVLSISDIIDLHSEYAYNEDDLVCYLLANASDNDEESDTSKSA